MNYLVRAGASEGGPGPPILLLLHIVYPASDGAAVIHYLPQFLAIRILQLSHSRVNVQLPLLDDSLPLPPTVLPVLLGGPGVLLCPGSLGDETDVLVVSDGVLSIGNLFLSPEI